MSVIRHTSLALLLLLGACAPTGVIDIRGVGDDDDATGDDDDATGDDDDATGDDDDDATGDDDDDDDDATGDDDDAEGTYRGSVQMSFTFSGGPGGGPGGGVRGGWGDGWGDDDDDDDGGGDDGCEGTVELEVNRSGELNGTGVCEWWAPVPLTISGSVDSAGMLSGVVEAALQFDTLTMDLNGEVVRGNLSGDVDFAASWITVEGTILAER